MLLSKPVAALSSNLLARKGEASPAIRRSYIDAAADIAEADEIFDRVISQREGDSTAWSRPFDRHTVRPSVKTRLVMADSQAAAVGRPRAATQHLGRCAFTLRLDESRHFKLRLAVAAAGRSAQQLLVEALDAFLVTLPEVEARTAHLPPLSNTIIQEPES